MSKLEQRRALGLRQYEERQGKIAALKPKPQKIAEAKQAIATVINPVINKSSPSNADRQAKWRSENPETHRERSRASMKKLRAKKKDHGTP